MAYTSYDKPGEFFGAGYTLGSSIVGLTTATEGSNVVLAQLSDTDAHPTTGQTQQVCLAIAEAIYQKLLAIATADKPTNMTCVRQSNIDDTLSIRTVSYVLTFKSDASTLTTVRPEA
jgi:hypothetical protein